MCSPQSIIFTAVTDGRKTYCYYSYRYWGHLEVVSPHWKTEQLHSHKGQVFITSSSVRIHRGILKSNWMHRRKEATKRHICILERSKKKKKEGKKITIIQCLDGVHVPSTTVLFLPCLMFDVPLYSKQSLCLMEEVITEAELWRAAFTTDPLTDVWARHADGCTHVNTHACIRTLCQTGSVLSGAAPRRKTCHDITQGSAGAGPGQEVSHRKLDEADFAMPLTGCGRDGWRTVNYTSQLSWLEPPGLWTCSLHKQTSHISLCNHIDEDYYSK